jgi:hypothetical protein
LDVIRAHRATLVHGPDDFAATQAFPRWTGIVNTDKACPTSIRKQVGLRRNEHPAGAVPAIDLYTLGEHAQESSIPRRNLQVIAIAQVRYDTSPALSGQSTHEQCSNQDCRYNAECVQTEWLCGSHH